VSDGGRTVGPYSGAMLDERLRRGGITAKALVWHEGWSDWQPIAVHFKFPEDRGADPADQPVNVANSLEGAGISILRGVVPPLISAAALIAYIAGEPGNDVIDPTTFVWLRIALAASMFVAAIFSALYWWNRAFSESLKFSGIVKVGVISGSVVVGVVCVVSLLNLPLQYRIHIARKSFDQYSVQTDVVGGTLTIRGLIGPGLSNAISTQIGANASISTVIIDSYGGLVDEALDTARAIQAHGNLTVRARGACNSACLIVFMSGDKRVAPRNLEFGFHATSAITPIAGAYNLEALSQLDSDADSYLRTRGIPDSMLDAARAAGPGKLVPVSAIELADVGAVTQLLDGDESISLARAKWMAIVDALRNVQGGKPLVGLFQTIDAVAPKETLTYGPELWRLSQSGDTRGVMTAVRTLIAKLGAYAMPAADDNAIVGMMRVTSIEIGRIRQQQSWDSCASFLDGKGFGSIRMPPNIASLEYGATAKLLKTAAARNWIPQGVPAWATVEGPSIAKAVALEMLANGEDIRSLKTDPRIACDWSADLLTAILEKPPSEAAGLYRWLLLDK
jgi:hypothetical protein